VCIPPGGGVRAGAVRGQVLRRTRTAIPASLGDAGCLVRPDLTWLKLVRTAVVDAGEGIAEVVG
jgi:hypothetical protein